MATTSTHQDRAAADAQARMALIGGDTRRAVHQAWRGLSLEIAALRKSDVPRAELLEASLAGALVAIAEGYAAQQPLRPPGYSGGRPATEHLLAAYDTARTETARQQQ